MPVTVKKVLCSNAKYQLLWYIAEEDGETKEPLKKSMCYTWISYTFHEYTYTDVYKK